MPRTSMYEFVCDRRLFVVRLRQASSEAAEGVALEVTRRYEELGESLFYVALVGPDAETPDPSTRAAILAALERNFDKMAMVRVVMFGSGVKTTILRSVTTVLALTLGMRGRRMYVDKNLRETAQVIAETLGYDAEEVVARVVAEGLLTREEAG